MSTWLRMLVIGGITVAACADVSSGDDAHIAHESDSQSERMDRPVDAGSASLDSGPGSARMQRDASLDRDASVRRELPVASEPDAEADSDLDAGIPELAAPILRDCTETLRCDEWAASSLEECIAISTSALARATEDAQQHFLAIAMRCNTPRGCDYVSCTRQP